MSVEVVEGERECSVTLAGVVDIFEAGTLQASAVAALERGGDIVVRLHQLERCDAAAAQVLIALKRAASAEERRLSFEGIPPAVAADWKVTGLAGHLP
jgi:anti-anti-sigma regulatory factor